MSQPQKTVAFFGASTGCGLSALKHTLAAGHKCIALLRDPSRISGVLSPETHPNLVIVKGNVHDVTAVSQCLKAGSSTLVDSVVFSIGAKFVTSKMSIEDVHVCAKGIDTVFQALAELRKAGFAGQPHITAISTTSLSNFGRDTPIPIVPLYAVLLKVPGADKKIMEDKLIGSGEQFTIVRASMLVNGETDNKIRAGIEDPKRGVESKAIGYRISREDVGRWIAQNLVLKRESKYVNKTASITW